MVDQRTIHIHDLAPEIETEFPESPISQYVRCTDQLGNPVASGRIAIGAILIRRTEVRPFTEKQIDLLKTFADQAVIAIENVRLFQELEARTRELARSVGELKALGEVGQAVSSTLELQTVLSTIVRHAVQLTGTNGGVIYEYDEATQEFHLRASYRMEEELIEALRATPIRSGKARPGKRRQSAPVQVRISSMSRIYRHSLPAHACTSRLSICSGGSAAARGANHGRLNGLSTEAGSFSQKW